MGVCLSEGYGVALAVRVGGLVVEVGLDVGVGVFVGGGIICCGDC